MHASSSPIQCTHSESRNQKKRLTNNHQDISWIMINPKQNHLQPSQVYLSVFSFFQSLHVIKSSNHLGPSSRTGPLNSRVLVLSGQLRLNIAGQGSRTPKSVRYLRWKVKICPKRGFLLKESHHSQESEKLNLEACNLIYIYIYTTT